jgi:hypothetical protein
VLSDSPHDRRQREMTQFIQAELAGNTTEHCGVRISATAGTIIPWRKAEYTVHVTFQNGAVQAFSRAGASRAVKEQDLACLRDDIERALSECGWSADRAWSNDSLSLARRRALGRSPSEPKVELRGATLHGP